MPKSQIRAELAQMPLEDGALVGNTDRILAAIGRADVAGGTQLLVFPELALCGFPSQSTIAQVAQTLDGPLLGRIRDAARAAGVAIALGLAERDSGKYFNTTVLIDHTGQVLLRYRKTHLWESDQGVFTPGDRFEVCRWGAMTVGILICFDIEFPETARALASLGADLLLVTNGNMDPYGPVHRRAIVARAMENQLFALLTNRCGDGADSLHFPGESMAVAPSGDILVAAGSKPDQLPAMLDTGELERSRQHYKYRQQARIPLGLMRDGDNALVVRQTNK